MCLRTRLIITISILLITSIGFISIDASSNIKNENTIVSQQINSTVIWENLDISQTVSIDIISGGNLTVINSKISISGTVNGIIINTGFLKLIDSIVVFDGVDHAVFGVTTGRILFENATVSSVNADAVHLEGNYIIDVNNSIFENSGDDGFHIENNNLDFNVTNSIFRNNGDEGFDLKNVNSNVFLKNADIYGNHGHGIKIVTSGNFTLLDSSLDGTGSTIIDDNRGIAIEDSQSFVANNISITNFPNDGIKAKRTHARINNFNIYNVGDEGIEFEAGISDKLFEITDGTIEKAYGGDGIKLEQIKGTILINNVNVISSADDGIQATGANNTIQIINTYVDGSAEDGFEIDSTRLITFDNVTSVRNTENGFKFKNLEYIDMKDTTASNNKFSGIDALNIMGINMTDIDVRNNILHGLVVLNSTSVIINSSNFTENRATNSQTDGIDMDNIESYNISNSLFSKNSGEGIKISNSVGYISSNDISYNELNGISIGGSSNFTIQNNTITNNIQNGIKVVNNSYGLINYNSFTGNKLYGLFVDIGEGLIINADSNYWGSDEGPYYQKAGDGTRDGIYGSVVINNILSENGAVIGYTPPKEIDFKVLFIIILSVIVVILLLAFAFQMYRNKQWRKETKPFALLYINMAGIPLLEHRFNKNIYDSALISGFITAINSFSVEDMENIKNEILVDTREIQGKGYSIILNMVQRSLVALVVTKSNSLVKKSMSNFTIELLNHVKQMEGIDLDEKIEVMDITIFENMVNKYFVEFIE